MLPAHPDALTPPAPVSFAMLLMRSQAQHAQGLVLIGALGSLVKGENRDKSDWGKIKNATPETERDPLEVIQDGLAPMLVNVAAEHGEFVKVFSGLRSAPDPNGPVHHRYHRQRDDPGKEHILERCPRRAMTSSTASLRLRAWQHWLDLPVVRYRLPPTGFSGDMLGEPCLHGAGGYTP